MDNHQSEVKQAKVVEDPRLSLTQFSRYHGSTLKGRQRILLDSKYPGDYIPKYYNIARKIITGTFSANFNDYDLYFEEFRRQATILKKEALAFPSNTDDYKNRYLSAGALEALIRMSDKLTPVLDRYVLNVNSKRAAILVNGVKISSKADMQLFDLAAEQIGLLRFNFSQSRLKTNEADLALKVLMSYAKDTDGKSLAPKHCLLIDIHSGNILTAKDNRLIESVLLDSCSEIGQIWKAL
jgi:hypothetical protein